MPLYNVEVTLTTTVVVEAQDEKDANAVAEKHWKSCVDYDFHSPEISVQSEIADKSQLYDGWDEHCLPYGGDKKIKEYLKK